MKIAAAFPRYLADPFHCSSNMKILIRSILLCALVCCAASLAAGQTSSSGRLWVSPVANAKGTGKAAGKPFIDAAGKAAVIVIKSAAKATLVTAKYATTNMLKPTAKKVLQPMIVKAAPIVAKYMLRGATLALKRGLPAALKLSLL
ncbi:MAG: hypothetical protein JO053_01370 [Acidobacteria bacterium]|nr:hypothetical protein [Acidobacteriota bacterium]